MDEHTVNLRPPLWLPVLVALVAGGCYMAGKYIEVSYDDDQYQQSISVSGEGKVYAEPDIAQLNFGVQTGRQATAETAMKMLTEKMNAVIAAVEASGVEEKDITTRNLSLYPAYDYDEGKRVERGYEANQSLSVKVRDLGAISNVLDAAIKNGANQAGNVSFTIDDIESLREQARELAIEDAKMKAMKLESQLDVDFGDMIGFWEDYNSGPMPYYERAVMMDSAEGVGGGGMVAPSLPAGEQEVVIRVNLTYELED